MDKVWTDRAWGDYQFWIAQDKKTFNKINSLLKDIERGGQLGQAELLKGDLAGWCSRKIDKANRLIYRIEDGKLIISGCRTHYGDK